LNSLCGYGKTDALGLLLRALNLPLKLRQFALS
jgi:hypothetical protein